MPLKPHPNDPDKMVYVSRQYDIPQPQGIPQLQGVTTAQPEQEQDATMQSLKDLWRSVCDGVGKAAFAQPAQEPWPEEPFGHMAGGVQPPQRPWVGLTNNELQPIADEYRILFGSWVEDFARAIEAKLKEKNT